MTDTMTSQNTDLSSWDTLYMQNSKVTVKAKPWNNAISGYRSRSRKHTKLCFGVSCLLCDCWYYFHVDMWIVVYYKKETVYDWLFLRLFIRNIFSQQCNYFTFTSPHNMFRPQTAIIRCLNYAKTVPLYRMYKMFTYSHHIQTRYFIFKIIDVTVETYLHWLISFAF
jgi:hypothetical protein